MWRCLGRRCRRSSLRRVVSIGIVMWGDEMWRKWEREQAEKKTGRRDMGSKARLTIPHSRTKERIILTEQSTILKRKIRSLNTDTSTERADRNAEVDLVAAESGESRVS